jgi:hypothetical protein
MSKRTVRIREGKPLLVDDVSYGRGGPRGSIGRLRPTWLIRRTVQRAPEMVVKDCLAALPIQAADKHMDHLGHNRTLAGRHARTAIHSVHALRTCTYWR